MTTSTTATVSGAIYILAKVLTLGELGTSGAAHQKLGKRAWETAIGTFQSGDGIGRDLILGELLRDMPKQHGARGIGKSGVPLENSTSTLSDLGISKKVSFDDGTRAVPSWLKRDFRRAYHRR